ncbi:MAG: reverse transcriptase family protein [Butyricicoccaceae bacterium]
MIVYRELSSLEKDMGFSARALYAASSHRPSHYRRSRIPKGGGEYRELCMPDGFLKAIQRSIAEHLLAYEAVSPFATAYRPGGSTLVNARPHVGRPVVLKLDIRHFFDRIIYPMVKEKAFPAQRYSEANRVLLTLLCTYQDALPQGAPTSPAISNIVMKDFDDQVGRWCRERGIVYTRYCDDMTFSGDFAPRAVIDFVRPALREMGFFLNDGKTVAVRSGQKKTVTGIVVNEKPNVPASYRRQLRQELYFCRKYGVEEHIRRTGADIAAADYLRQLLGRVNYVLQITPDNAEMRQYRAWLLQAGRT